VLTRDKKQTFEHSIGHVFSGSITKIMLLKFEAEAKSLRPRPKGPQAKAEARGYEAKAKALGDWPIGLEALTSLVRGH